MGRASVSAINLRHILAFPEYASATITVNVTWMKKRIQCLSNASQHVPIYLQPFQACDGLTDGQTDRQTDRRPAYSVKTFWIWRHSLCKFLENFMSHQALTTFWYQYMTTIWYRLNSGQKWDPFFQFGATLASTTSNLTHRRPLQ